MARMRRARPSCTGVVSAGVEIGSSGFPAACDLQSRIFRPPLDNTVFSAMFSRVSVPWPIGMRRPGYPRDPATRVNGAAGVTPATPPGSFPPRLVVSFLATPLSTFLPSRLCLSNLVERYSSLDETRENLVGLFEHRSNAFEDVESFEGGIAFGSRWRGWIDCCK